MVPLTCFVSAAMVPFLPRHSVSSCNPSKLHMLPPKLPWGSTRPNGGGGEGSLKSTTESSTHSSTSIGQDMDRNTDDTTTFDEIVNVTRTGAKVVQEHIGSGIFDITKEWGEDLHYRAGFIGGLFASEDQENNGFSVDDGPEMNHFDNEGVEVKEKIKRQQGIEEIDRSGVVRTSDDEGEHKEHPFDLSAVLPPNPFSKSGSEKIKTVDSFEHTGRSFINLFSGEKNSKPIEEIVVEARRLSQGDIPPESSISEVIEAGQEVIEGLEKTMGDFFGDTKPPPLNPANLFYWFEQEDATKNFAWKRRQHRFCPSIDLDSELERLDRMLHFANLCYEDTLEEIKKELEDDFNHELLFCDMQSRTNEPSHFIAIQRDQSNRSNHLEVTLVVRGTKTLTDIITDVLCEEVEYRGGTAHSGMLESGRHITEKHRNFFRQLRDLSSKPRLKLTIIGHSLGAGAASIAGMELNDEDFIDVEVYGFGTPSCVSKDVSESTKDFITSIVADNDVVPRLNAATFINAILDVGEYNWTSYAHDDFENTIQHIDKSLPSILEGSKKKLWEVAKRMLLESAEIPESTTKRMNPTLFPPGKCIHFYRDGYGMSAVEVPCTFFDELDFNRRMFEDHLYFSGYKNCFLEIARQHHKNHHYQFETDQLLMKRLATHEAA